MINTSSAPAQSHISPSILVYENETGLAIKDMQSRNSSTNTQLKYIDVSLKERVYPLRSEQAHARLPQGMRRGIRPAGGRT